MFSTVCCPTSSATFSVTIGSVTGNSTLRSCATEGTFSNFVVTTPGNKLAATRLRASTCPSLDLNLNVPFVDGQRYLFQVDIENGQPAVNVFAQEITVPTAKQLPSAERLTRAAPITDKMTNESVSE